MNLYQILMDNNQKFLGFGGLMKWVSGLRIAVRKVGNPNVKRYLAKIRPKTPPHIG
jgi:hypothetical protein